MRSILVADDNEGQRKLIVRALAAKGYSVREAVDGREALSAAGDGDFDLVITDVKMPAMTGVELLAELRRREVQTPVIVMTAYGSIESAVEAMRLGAADYLTKPLSLEELAVRVERLFAEVRAVEEVRYLRQAAHGDGATATTLLGASGALMVVRDLIGRVATSDSTVLITGESGTGKELVARAIHEGSARAKGPLVTVNCAAIPETLLESELFGHERGAFTGALRRARGRFEVADKGTLFLDEIGEVPPTVQAKLLRAVQERSFERVGGEQPIRVDVRIIAATNRDLSREVAAGRFREDLYYRLRVVEIAIPPLRARPEDIEVLAPHFAETLGRRCGRRIARVEPSAMEALRRYPWPGNVRELMHAIERAVVLGSGDAIALEDLPVEVQTREGAQGLVGRWSPHGRGGGVPDVSEVESEIEESMRARLIQALKEAKGNKSRASDLLGMKRSTYYFNLKKYNLL